MFVGMLACAAPLAAQAQPDGAVTQVVGSVAPACKLPGVDPHSLDSDALPGMKLFAQGSIAFGKGDFRHAVHLFEVAASWGYKPAEYDLGLMYFRGHGVPVDRPLGTAWMVLAAERGDPFYAHARDVMATLLSDAEFRRTNELWNELKATYGDDAARRRAMTHLGAVVGNSQVGTRVGGSAGPVREGRLGLGGGLQMVVTTPVRGAPGYGVMQLDDSPYDTGWGASPCPAGTVRVGPLHELGSAAGASGPHAGPDVPSAHGRPPVRP